MTENATPLLITPDTKVGALLKEYPQLEEVLMNLSPAFSHLRNPVLRRTVGKVANLQQVAKVGNMPLATLINSLREAAGVGGDEWKENTPGGEDNSKPEWLKGATIVKSFDARPVIAGGGHPVAQVMGDIWDLKPGEVYEFVTPFLPSPLLDMAKNKGYRTWSFSPEAGVYRNYIALAV